MKKYFIGLLAISLVLFGAYVGFGKDETFTVAKRKGLSFGYVYDNLDLKKNTKLYTREFWKEVEGKEVVWKGIVFDVRGGRGKAKVYVVNKKRAPVKGYNIILVIYDISNAAKLKKGQKIRFRGYLHNYKSGKRGGVVIILRDAEIL